MRKLQADNPIGQAQRRVSDPLFESFSFQTAMTQTPFFSRQKLNFFGTTISWGARARAERGLFKAIARSCKAAVQDSAGQSRGWIGGKIILGIR